MGTIAHRVYLISPSDPPLCDKTAYMTLRLRFESPRFFRQLRDWKKLCPDGGGGDEKTNRFPVDTASADPLRLPGAARRRGQYCGALRVLPAHAGLHRADSGPNRLARPGGDQCRRFPVPHRNGGRGSTSRRAVSHALTIRRRERYGAVRGRAGLVRGEPGRIFQL